MKKNILLLPIVFWLILFIVEVISFFFQHPKPMYFRAWEYVLNEGKDSYYVPFQPRIFYNGPMTGDLLLVANFLPRKKDVRHQIFQADEYGFRNEIGTYGKGARVVLMGTSFVGGAQETQSNLISDLLTNKYKITTYNYATYPLQHFWEDARFVKKPPKYVVIVMNESEALQNTWVEVLVPSKTTHEVRSWKSHKQWMQNENTLDLSYNRITTVLKRFSIVKYELNKLYLTFINLIFPRSSIASNLVKLNTYDPSLDMLFWDSNSYDPRINKKAIKDTINTLKESQRVLKSRNITLIVAIMPSKTTLYYREYKDIDPQNESLYTLENAMEKNGIEHVDLFALMKSQKSLLYYKDDGHWNSEANRIIADQLNKKIQELETTN